MPKRKPETISERTARLKAARLTRDAEIARRPKPYIVDAPYPPRRRVFDMDSEMPFGKFKGQTITDMLATDDGSSWLRWALENIGDFEVTDEVLAILET